MNCPECDTRMGVVKTMVLGDRTKRLQECACGTRVETEEKVIRRLPVLPATTGQSARNGPGSAGNPPATAGGIGGGLSGVQFPDQSSDSNPQSSLLSVPRAPARSRRRAVPEPTAEFNRFWARWPRKVSKPAAIIAWNDATADSRDVQRIEAIHRVLDWEVDEFMRREPNARPHAATWLNGRGWENEKPAPAVRPSRPTFTPFKDQERAAREERDLDARADLLLGARR